MASRLENAIWAASWEGSDSVVLWGQGKGSAERKYFPKIFTRQRKRTRLVTRTFQRDTLQQKQFSRPVPQKGGKGQIPLPPPKAQLILLLKINTVRARRHLPNGS